MGDLFGIEPLRLATAAQEWDEASSMASTISSELAGQGTNGLAPRVVGAAATFLSTWAGYAGESVAITAGMAEGLRGLAADTTRTDDETSSTLHSLDSRLGPAR